MPKGTDVALSIDALGPQLTGIGRYTLELALGLRDNRDIGRISYFRGDQWLADPELALADDGHVRGSRMQRKLAHWRGRLGATKAIIHGPNYFLPSWVSEGIITVHDLSVMRYPETHPIERVKDFELRFQRSLDRARLIITDSNTVREEMIGLLGIDERRIKCVPLGVDVPSHLPPPINGVLGHYQLSPGSYTLCVSTFEPRKRIGQLVAAYARLPVMVRQCYPLVLAGATGWLNEDLLQRITAGVDAGWLKLLNFVPDDVRNVLYRGARLFVYPSVYEGFGLPPLEAMAHGVPTIVGDAATLVEVTKGAAQVACVDDIDAFSDLIATMLQDEPLRFVASEGGRKIALGYTWSKCVAETIAVYKLVAS